MKNYCVKTSRIKINLKIVLVLFCFFFITNLHSQQSLNLKNNVEYVGDDILFYDDGGANNPVGNIPFQSTIKAQSGAIKMFFNYVDIPSDATLKIYKGLDTLELIAVIDKKHKSENMYGFAFTFVYVPGVSNVNSRGWEGVIQPYSGGGYQQVAVTLPESDCVGAIQLCSNSIVNTSANQYENTGVINDDNGSCYSGTGSGGSVWYSFSPISNGNIDFMISPLGSTDYDFVLWNITSGCASKTQLSCNFSGTNGATGLNSSGSSNSQDASGTTNNSLVAVNTTQIYAICINYYGGTNGGFNLNFQNVAGTVAVTDATVPTILNAYSTNCASSSSYTVNFSEYMNCSTIQASDFAIPGYTISLTSTNCLNGRTDQVVVSVSPTMPAGSYTMTANNMTDICGNALNSTYVINTTTVPVANAGPDRVTCSTPGGFGSTNYGTATLTGSGGTSYDWSNGQTLASISVTPTTTTTYTLTAISGSCGSTDQVLVTVAASPTPNLGPDQTLCSGFPITFSASGGASYQWQSTTSTSFFGTPTSWVNIAGATSSSYTGTPGTTIYYQVIVTNAAGCTGTDYIKVTLGAGVFGVTAPTFVCSGQSATLSLPSAMTAYTWSVGGSPIGTANTALVVTPASSTTYLATSTTAGCTGTASVTVIVHSPLTLTTAANPAAACAGFPVALSSTGPTDITTTVTEDFEAANSFTPVNGSYNRWYWGTSAFAAGARGLYIGTATGNNNYEIGSFFSDRSATNHAYKNYAVTSYCNATLNFKWKCGGNASSALRVWIIPTSVTPTAGTALTASSTQFLAGGPYFGTPAAYTNVSINLTQYAGQSIRVVFSWVSNGPFGTAVANPAASIDDVVFSETSTYNYNWTSSPAGFSASTVNASASPIVATNYNLTVTRCDGCPVSSTASVVDCIVLQTEISSFIGKCDGSQIAFEWTAQSEINSNYIIEQSTDGIKFTSGREIESVGNTNQINYYNANVPISDSHYFRLKQSDYNGNSAYSEIINVSCIGNEDKLIRTFPNPASDEVTVKFDLKNSKEVLVQIMNVLGQKVIDVSNPILNVNTVTLSVSSLSPGAYNLAIFSAQTGEVLGVTKFLKK